MYSTNAIFVRDNLTDNGNEPLSQGGLSLSPDIIHVVDEIADPQTVLGSTGAMLRDDLSEMVEEGQTNYVYVRVQKNGVFSDKATVDIYWAKPSTLPTPSIWMANKIDDSKEIDINSGETKIVGPFLFNDVPETGHYCFVAIVNSRKNPKPDISTISTFNDFRELVRKKSNVAWKNFDVVDEVAGGEMDMDFQVNSFKNISEDNHLEFDLTKLPNGVKSQIRILKRIVVRASTTNLTLLKESKLYKTFESVDNNQVISFKNIKLKSREETSVRLKLIFPDNITDGAYDINVRQLKENTEYGRVTRRINIGDFPFLANKRTNEIHRANCPWVPKMSNRNKKPFRKMETGLRQGYDGCFTCLNEFDNG